MSENPEMFQSLLNDYEEIRINLERELSGADKTALYMNLKKLEEIWKRTDRNRKIGVVYRFDETDCKDCGLYLQ